MTRCIKFGLTLALLLAAIPATPASAQNLVCQGSSCRRSIITCLRTTVADAAYVAAIDDCEIAVTSITATRVITLIDPATLKTGQRVWVKDESGSVTGSVKITLTPANSATIDGAAGLDITTAFGSVELASDGTNYKIVVSTPTFGASSVTSAVTTTDALDVNATSLTSGAALKVTGSGAALLTSGKVIDAEMGAATVGAGVKVVTSGVYTDTAAAPLWITATGATTPTFGLIHLTGTGLTSGIGMQLQGGGVNMTTGGIVADIEMGAATVGSGVKVVTSGAYADTAAAPLWVSAPNATTTTFGLVRVDGAALTSGSAMVIKGGAEANVTVAGRYLSIQDNAGAEQFGVGVDGHQVFAQTSAPVVTNTGGSGPSCVGCTDTNGKLVVTTAGNTNVITLTFHTSATPRGCVIAPADANTAVDIKAAGGGVVVVAAGTFTVSAPAANWAANAKNIYYSCFF